MNNLDSLVNDLDRSCKYYGFKKYFDNLKIKLSLFDNTATITSRQIVILAYEIFILENRVEQLEDRNRVFK